VAEELGLPVTTSFHTNFHDYAGHYGLGWLRVAAIAHLRRFHGRGRIVLVPTDQTRRHLAGLGFRNLVVVPRGVDADRFHPARRSALLRAQWGASDADLVVLSVGRLAPEKNLALAERAFEAMSAVRPDGRLVVVGEGPERAPMARRHPECLFTGPQHGRTLAAHYASADVLLFPSLSETFGNVVLEAMASGLAVVAYDDAAAREHVRDGENGLLAPRGDETAYLERAVRAAREPGLSRRLGRAARRTIESLTWVAAGDRFERALREVATARQTSVKGRIRSPAPAFGRNAEEPGGRG
jgi:glycosyltransferase involved in cell wall biosynthesis